jgi:hypothetical protein
MLSADQADAFSLIIMWSIDQIDALLMMGAGILRPQVIHVGVCG